MSLQTRSNCKIYFKKMDFNGSVLSAASYESKSSTVMQEGDLDHQRNFLNSFVDGTPGVIQAWMSQMARQYPALLCVPGEDVKKGTHCMWFDDGMIHHVDGFDKAILSDRCSRKRFSAWILVFRTGSGEIHANAMMYDRKKGLLSRYEPRGFVKTSYDHRVLDAALREFAITVLDCSAYLCPHMHQSKIGTQTKEVLIAPRGIESLPSNGPCAIWSMFFMIPVT